MLTSHTSKSCHPRMSRVTHTNESCHPSMSPVTHRWICHATQLTKRQRSDGKMFHHEKNTVLRHVKNTPFVVLVKGIFCFFLSCNTLLFILHSWLKGITSWKKYTLWFVGWRVYIFFWFFHHVILFFVCAQLTKGYYVMKKSEGADQVDFFKS